MSEKETPDSVEEQVNEEVSETEQELEASAEENQDEAPESGEKEMEASAEDVQVGPEEVEEAPQTPPVKKGLMERRPSYSQSSVPNAHRGYSGTPPIIMLLIISVFVLLSIIFATSAVIN